MDLEENLFGDELPPTTEERLDSVWKVANPFLGAKHLRSQNSTPLSSPSRDRNKRQREAKFNSDSSENEGK